MPPEQAAQLPSFAAGCSAELLAAAKAFFPTASPKIPGMEVQLAHVAEQVTACIRLRERDFDRVAAYLKQFAGRSCGLVGGQRLELWTRD